jgi:hypothetical protein
LKPQRAIVKTLGKTAMSPIVSKYRLANLEFQFSDDDVVNPDDYDQSGYPNAYLLHDHGFPLAVVFAADPEEAMELATSAGKLDSFVVSRQDLEDADRLGPDSFPSAYEWLGTPGRWIDTEGIGVVQLPLPPFSFCALFNAAFGG